MPSTDVWDMGWPAPIRTIQAAVCEVFGITRLELLSPRRDPRLVRARQTAFWLARQAGYSYSAIARAFADRDHTTVIYGCSRVEQGLAFTPAEAAAMTQVLRHFGWTVPLP